MKYKIGKHEDGQVSVKFLLENVDEIRWLACITNLHPHHIKEVSKTYEESKSLCVGGPYKLWDKLDCLLKELG